MNTVTINQTLDASVEQVWNALTDASQMRQWYFDLPEFKAEEGYTFQFEGQGNTGEKYLHFCEVTQVKHQEVLEYSWTYEQIEGYSLVRFSLTQLSDNHTQLRLTHTGLDSFPKDNSDFAAESFDKGWTALVTQSLVGYLGN